MLSRPAASGEVFDGLADAAGQVPGDPEGGGERDQEADGEGDHAGVGEGAFDVGDLGGVGWVSGVEQVGVEQGWADDGGGQAGAGHDGEQDDGLGDEQPGAEPPGSDRVEQAGHPSSHPVADAADGGDVARLGGVVVELLAEVGDVDVDDVFVADPGGVPDGVDELAAAEGDAGLGGQDVEDVELGAGERDGLVADPDLAAGGVDAQVAEHARAPPRGRRRVGGGGAAARSGHGRRVRGC